MSKLNPQIRTIEVGRKSIRQVTVYPLSMSDQFRTTDLITDLVTTTLAFIEKSKDSKEVGDIDVIKEIVTSLEANLTQILDLIVDDNVIRLDDLTNLQFSELADLVFEVNYSGAVGNFQGLISKIKTLLQLTRPSQKSSEEPVTDLNTSSIEALGTEE